MPRVATSEQGCSGKCKLLLLLNTFRFEEVLYLVCNTEQAFIASVEHKDIVYVLVKKQQKRFFIFWIIFISDLVLSFIDKM